ncbi:MAG: hypothetical protein QOJ29_4106, partial [Thermoleophilaceae bacterium]|nr:hypothetical protein [Thermoleophilaceae bacterium]
MPYEPDPPTGTAPPPPPPPLSFDDVGAQQTERQDHYPETYRPEPA